MNYERESAWLLIGVGGAAVFMCAMCIASLALVGVAAWSFS